MKSPEPTYNTTGHLSQSQLQRYSSGQLEGAEMNRVERHLLGCALCSDALEGLSMLAPGQAAAAVDSVKARLAAHLNAARQDAARQNAARQDAARQKEQEELPVIWGVGRWAAAACISLLVVAAVYLLISNLQAVDQQLAQQENLEEITTTPAPANRGMADEQIQPPVPAPEASPATERAKSAIADKAEAPSLPEKEEKPLSQPAQKPGLIVENELEMEEVAEEPALPTALSGRAAGIQLEDKALTIAPPSMRLQQQTEEATGTAADSAPAASPASAATSVRIRGISSLAPDSRVIKGRVTEASSGAPLPGVNIRIKGSAQGTVTDINGEYTLHLPQAETALSFNFIGFREKTLAVSPEASNLNATLEEDTEALSEVVVTGYGTRRGSDNAQPAETTPPRPQTGMRNFRRWVKENQRYPAAALEAKAEGVVVVAFFVEADGALSGFRVEKSPGYGLGEEAIRLLKEGPAWQPATLNGQAVRQEESVRVPFKLPKD